MPQGSAEVVFSLQCRQSAIDAQGVILLHVFITAVDLKLVPQTENNFEPCRSQFLLNYFSVPTKKKHSHFP